jgi:hypothetical protein
VAKPDARTALGQKSRREILKGGASEVHLASIESVVKDSTMVEHIPKKAEVFLPEPVEVLPESKRPKINTVESADIPPKRRKLTSQNALATESVEARAPVEASLVATSVWSDGQRVSASVMSNGQRVSARDVAKERNLSLFSAFSDGAAFQVPKLKPKHVSQRR